MPQLQKSWRVLTEVESEAVERYGFVPVGKTEDCMINLYLITARQRIEHSGVLPLASDAGRGPLVGEIRGLRGGGGRKSVGKNGETTKQIKLIFSKRGDCSEGLGWRNEFWPFCTRGSRNG